MRFQSICHLSCVVAVVISGITRGANFVHERRDSVPDGFTKNGPASDDTILNLRLALKQSNISGLHSALYDVSTPSSEHYGQHLTKQKVIDFVAPSQKSKDVINAWLSEHGLSTTTLSPSGDWLGLRLSVAQANEVFDANFSSFTHQASGEESVRTLSYSIPEHLQDHLILVHPTITFPNPRSGNAIFSTPAPARLRSVDSSASGSCNANVTPTCVQSLYNIPTSLATEPSNMLGISGFIDQWANEADLKSFLMQYRPDLSPDDTFALQTLDGGSNPQQLKKAGIEADIDVQWTIGIASGVPTVFISVGAQYHDGDLEGFLDIANFLLAEENPPQVLTTSYGQDEYTISKELALILCNAYAQLSARGISVIYASGDGGVAGSSQNTSCHNFVPSFPSGCPFVTSVGATVDVNPEVAAYFSAGGFSNYFPRPWYQDSAVSGYLSQLGHTYKGRYNSSGRGYPDVSALGENLKLVYTGMNVHAAGTSCASPIFASVISLLNDRLIAAGKPVLGFLNPFLYSSGASSLKDITSGSNPGCKTKGFHAVDGWDPVTGLGTPNFTSFLAAVGL
ncbi:family S53 protease [Artomyces pyxidatus]|uniref:Family S53 protease n=1 Tax=Artomyces pyxidatus TaxID=48021 RepID=A0ACB8SQX1_9AGAM|nr:family S53 protease [Artomyces pyxidatus]